MTVSKRIINLETESAFSILAKANSLISEGKDIINLGIGQPDFPTPINILEDGLLHMFQYFSTPFYHKPHFSKYDEPITIC